MEIKPSQSIEWSCTRMLFVAITCIKENNLVILKHIKNKNKKITFFCLKPEVPPWFFVWVLGRYIKIYLNII